MLRFRGLLGTDIEHHPRFAYSIQLKIASLVHIDVLGHTKGAKRNHYTAGLLNPFAHRAIENIVHQLMRFAGAAATRLYKL